MKQFSTLTLKAFDRAKATMDDTEAILAEEHTLAAINRAYYTVYYAMTALLLSENFYVKTHKGTITKFNEIFVKKGLFNRDAAQLVSIAYTLRQKADYDLEVDISSEDAHDLVKRARVFLTEVTLYFEQHLSEPD
jgi:uncharacterized protein (UPF0332 family)